MRHFFSGVCALTFLLLFFLSPSCAVTIEATGHVAADMPCYRDAALADAMREAVRQGVGIELASASGMHRFELVYDEIFSRAFGYLKRYEILRSGVDEQGFYFVTISADVEEGAPELNDLMTLQALSRMKGSPRIAVHITEKVDGIAPTDTGANWMRRAASDCGLQVIDTDRAEQVDSLFSKRAAALGREQEATLRREHTVSEYDYILEGTILGSYAGEKSYYGSLPTKRFSLAFNARVIDAATGKVAVAETPPSMELSVRRVASEITACREAIHCLMEGKNHTDGAGQRVLRRLFIHWLAEQDLGNIYRLEFTGLDLASARALQEKLKENRAIGDIRIRSIDAAAVSVIDCEVRLSPTELAPLIEKLAPGYHLDRSENRYLSFRK